jgi:hypothetical protein
LRLPARRPPTHDSLPDACRHPGRPRVARSVRRRRAARGRPGSGTRPGRRRPPGGRNDVTPSQRAAAHPPPPPFARLRDLRELRERNPPDFSHREHREHRERNQPGAAAAVVGLCAFRLAGRRRTTACRMPAVILGDLGSPAPSEGGGRPRGRHGSGTLTGETLPSRRAERRYAKPKGGGSPPSAPFCPLRDLRELRERKSPGLFSQRAQRAQSTQRETSCAFWGGGRPRGRHGSGTLTGETLPSRRAERRYAKPKGGGSPPSAPLCSSP